MAELGVGERVGRFEILGALGEGAMAMVYEAHDPEIDRAVAIKLLKDEWLVDKEYLTRFSREAKAAGALSHPNIVTIFDVGSVDDVPFITMECCKGGSLGDRMEAGEQFDLQTIMQIGIQLAEGLDYAHQRGVVHRDIKPSNILFSDPGTPIKITDFGIARRESRDDLNRTRVGTVIGTPRYMSPEQALGREVDQRTDLFAVGLILYELITGKPTFDADTTTSLLMQIANEQPQPIRKRAPGTPVGLARIINKLLSKKSERRFQTGAELAMGLRKELSALVEHESEERRNKYVPFKVKWAAGIGLIVSLVLALSISTVYQVLKSEITKVVFDSGSSLAQYIAIDVAEPVLSADWVTLESIVQEASQRDTFEYLIIADHDEIVRAATDQTLVGQQLRLPGPAVAVEAQPEGSDVAIVEIEPEEGPGVFNFTAKVYYQVTQVGSVNLGLSQNGLNQVMGDTRWLMFLLAIVTVACVVLMLYIIGGLLSGPISALRDAMADLGGGNGDRRISIQRNDEFGVLFSAFNEMADELYGSEAASEAAEAASAEEPDPSENEQETVLRSHVDAETVPPGSDEKTMIVTHEPR